MIELHFITVHLMKATTGVSATSKGWPGDMDKVALKYKKTGRIWVTNSKAKSKAEVR